MDQRPTRLFAGGHLSAQSSAAVAVEPCGGAFNDRSAGPQGEAFRTVGSFDDFDCPVAGRGQRATQFFTGIAAIGEDMAQLGTARSDFGQLRRRSVAVLNIGGTDDSRDKVAAGVGQDMALPAPDLLARVIAANSPAFRGFASLGF